MGWQEERTEMKLYDPEPKKVDVVIGGHRVQAERVSVTVDESGREEVLVDGATVLVRPVGCRRPTKRRGQGSSSLTR